MNITISKLPHKILNKGIMKITSMSASTLLLNTHMIFSIQINTEQKLENFLMKTESKKFIKLYDYISLQVLK